MILRILNYLIKFFRKKMIVLGVPVIIQNDKGEILLGKRNKEPIFYPNTWGLPGGLIEYDETIEKTGKREVMEELGVEIKILKRSKNVYEDFPNENCRIHLVDIPLYARIIKGVPRTKNETSEVKWFKPEKIKKMKLAYNHKEILKGEGLVK